MIILVEKLYNSKSPAQTRLRQPNFGLSFNFSDKCSSHQFEHSNVVTINQRIIARAHNSTEKLNDVTAHAEIQAITSASNFLNGKYLSNCTLYVTLEPCIMCMGALFWSKLDRIVYAASDPKNGFRKNNISPHPKTKITKGIMENESSNLLKAFFRARRGQNIFQ